MNSISIFINTKTVELNKARLVLKENIFHVRYIVTYERMKNWAKFTQNAILLHCLFLFIENLTFPSSISFPINMEGSKTPTTCIGHLSSSTKNKQKKKQNKDTTLWQKVCCLAIHQITLSFKFIVTPTRGKTELDHYHYKLNARSTSQYVEWAGKWGNSVHT